jgi:cell fate regulator YaaT (PSP1 superfamily)
LDERKIVLEFNTAERLELRDLYRSLGDALHVRIELRAVGPRDAAKGVGGVGRCGLESCCTSWLDKFESVSVRMAKEQALPIIAEGLGGPARPPEGLPAIRRRAVPGRQQDAIEAWRAG